MTRLATTNIVNGLINIKGPDAAKFLQGQLTCDINELNNVQALPGAYCTPQGRIRANFIIFQQGDNDFLRILPESQVAFLIDALAPFVAFFKCTIEDVSRQWQVSGIQIAGESASLQLNNTLELQQAQWKVSSTEELICIAVSDKTDRWLCLSKQPLIDIAPDFETMDEVSWQYQELLSGLVWIDETNRDKFLPHDISLPDLGAVSFTKGCYVGQEIVARMQYRGEPKYLLAFIKTEPLTEKPQDLLVQLVDNKEQSKIGETIKMLQLEDNSWLICASLKRTLLKQQQIQLSFGEKRITCSIIIPDLIKESENK